MNKILATTFLVLLTGSSFSQNKINSKFGNGLYNVIAADSSWSMKFGLRFQSLFVGEWNVNDTAGFGVGTSEFLIRRARLKFDGFAGHPRLTYKFELGLSNRDIGRVDSRNNNAPNIVMDALLKWNFYKNFTLWVGQTKLPGNRERVISSGDLQFVDRSMLNSEFNIDRDIGLQLRHNVVIGKSFKIREAVSISQGEGRNVVQENFGGYQYTGRIEILPFGDFVSKGDYVGSDLKREVKPKLAIGATYDWNDRAVKDRGNQGSYMSYDLDKNGSIDGYFHSNVSSIHIDLMFKYKGFSVMGEYAKRSASEKDVSQTIVNDDLSTTTRTVSVGEGLNLQAGYVFKTNWEVAARYTAINPETVTGKSATSQYTFGVSKYVVGHKLKVQTDVSYLTTAGSADNQFMYRLQFDIHF